MTGEARATLGWLVGEMSKEGRVTGSDIPGHKRASVVERARIWSSAFKRLSTCSVVGADAKQRRSLVDARDAQTIPTTLRGSANLLA